MMLLTFIACLLMALNGKIVANPEDYLSCLEVCDSTSIISRHEGDQYYKDECDCQIEVLIPREKQEPKLVYLYFDPDAYFYEDMNSNESSFAFLRPDSLKVKKGRDNIQSLNKAINHINDNLSEEVMNHRSVFLDIVLENSNATNSRNKYLYRFQVTEDFLAECVQFQFLIYLETRTIAATNEEKMYMRSPKESELVNLLKNKCTHPKDASKKLVKEIKNALAEIQQDILRFYSALSDIQSKLKDSNISSELEDITGYSINKKEVMSIPNLINANLETNQHNNNRNKKLFINGVENFYMNSNDLSAQSKVTNNLKKGSNKKSNDIFKNPYDLPVNKSMSHYTSSYKIIHQIANNFNHTHSLSNNGTEIPSNLNSDFENHGYETDQHQVPKVILNIFKNALKESATTSPYKMREMVDNYSIKDFKIIGPAEPKITKNDSVSSSTPNDNSTITGTIKSTDQPARILIKNTDSSATTSSILNLDTTPNLYQKKYQNENIVKKAVIATNNSYLLNNEGILQHNNVITSKQNHDFQLHQPIDKAHRENFGQNNVGTKKEKEEIDTDWLDEIFTTISSYKYPIPSLNKNKDLVSNDTSIVLDNSSARVFNLHEGNLVSNKSIPEKNSNIYIISDFRNKTSNNMAGKLNITLIPDQYKEEISIISNTSYLHNKVTDHFDTNEDPKHGAKELIERRNTTKLTVLSTIKPASLKSPLKEMKINSSLILVHDDHPSTNQDMVNELVNKGVKDDATWGVSAFNKSAFLLDKYHNNIGPSDETTQTMKYSKTTKHKDTTSDEHPVKGKLYFLFKNNSIPLKFIQNDDGLINIGVDGITICDELHQRENSLFFKLLCKCLISSR